MALYGVSVVKADPCRLEDYKRIFDGSTLFRHYGDMLYEWLEAGLADGELWIAEARDGEAVGAMIMTLDSVYANLPYLALLGVRSDYRNKGVGEKLIRFFIDTYEAMGIDRGFIAVNDFNPRARLLYTAMGFEKFTSFPEAKDPSHSVYLLMRKSHLKK